MKFWHPYNTDRICSRVEELKCNFVVDIGASAHKFPMAHETVGWEADRKVDLDNDPLPYDDQSVDFVYCRHTIEDLANPEHLLREIRRVAKAGYIETPSPKAELTRGVDAYGTHLGYTHHRWLVFQQKDKKLLLLPKYPIIERLPIPDQWERLKNGPAMWNTEYFWTGPLNFKVLKNELDFHLGRIDERTVPVQYLDWLISALE